MCERFQQGRASDVAVAGGALSPFREDAVLGFQEPVVRRLRQSEPKQASLRSRRPGMGAEVMAVPRDPKMAPGIAGVERQGAVVPGGLRLAAPVCALDDPGDRTVAHEYPARVWPVPHRPGTFRLADQCPCPGVETGPFGEGWPDCVFCARHRQQLSR